MKIKKGLLKKLIFVLSLALVLTNCYFILSGKSVFAVSTTVPDVGEATVSGGGGAISAEDIDSSGEATDDSMFTEATKDDSAMLKGFEGLLSGLVGVITFLPRICLLAVGYLIKILMNAFASLTTSSIESVSIEHILFAGYRDPDGSFNGIDFMDVNFFDRSGGDTIVAFRSAIAQWYYVMRLISAAILLVILIYVGIRMALATVASEQAKYKQMLTDWATSLALLFLLHYIMIFIISINSALIGALGGMLKSTATIKVDLLNPVTWLAGGWSFLHPTATIGEFLNAQLVSSIWADGINGLFAGIMYCALQWQAFTYFLFYLKRMITVGFLIIVAPLITITYSIDKMGDSKAQALNAWLKEFTYNILIQPFHCVVYLAFFGAISKIIATGSYGNIGVYILAYAVMKFMKTAEELLRKIFHFEANSMPAIGAPAKDFVAATGKAATVGMAAGKSFSHFKNAGGVRALTSGVRKRIDEKQTRDKAQRQVDREVKQEFGGNKEQIKAYKQTNEYKDRVVKTAVQMKHESDRKRTAKARKIYDRKHGEGTYDKMIEEKVKNKYNAEHGAGAYERIKEHEENGTMTAEDKKAKQEINRETTRTQRRENHTIIANSNIAKRAANKTGEITDRAITGVTTMYKGVRRWTQESEVGKAAVGFAKDSAMFALHAAGWSYAAATGDMAGGKIASDVLGGFGTAAFKNTTKELVQDNAKIIDQMAAVEGWSQEEAEARTPDIINEANAESAAGSFKTLGDDQKKLINKLTEIFGDNKAEATKFVIQIKAAIANREKLDLYDIIENLALGDNVTDEDKQKAIDESKPFTRLFQLSQIAGNNSVGKNEGYEADTFGRMTQKYVNVYETNNYQYNNYDVEYDDNTPGASPNTPPPTPQTPPPPQTPPAPQSDSGNGGGPQPGTT